MKPLSLLAYKALGNVEKSFRTFKGVDILVRPIRHWTSDRVRAHILRKCARTAQVKAHPLLGRCALALELRSRCPPPRETRSQKFLTGMNCGDEAWPQAQAEIR